MFRPFLIILFLFFSFSLFAQKADSIFVWQADNKWVIKHKIKAGETVFGIARRYHVPPAMLAGFNNISYQKELVPESKIFVPLGAYNIVATKPAQMNDYRPIYFRVDKEENLNVIAKNTGVSSRTILQWNNLNQVRAGQVLLVGWILYDATEIKESRLVQNSTALPVRKDTLFVIGKDTIRRSAPVEVLPELTEGEKLYLAETNNEENASSEKGTAVFFQRSGKNNDGIYFAFHNTAKRGSIIRITNIGTDKTVYAKVIGPVPGTGHYYNTIIGISNDAREALDVREDKAWCEVSFSK